METQEEYESREAGLLYDQIEALGKEPLSVRKEARQDWAEAMVNERDIIAERLVWLFQGAYGFGAQQRAERIAGNKRLNREAAIGQLLAAVEWQCYPQEAAKAWNSIPSEDQTAVNAVITEAITAYLESVK